MATVHSTASSVVSGRDRPIPTVLGGRYALTSRIALGGMGEVWSASDEVLGRDVAVKILRPDLVGAPTFLGRFRAEARHTAGLVHPGIACVFDYGEEMFDGHCLAYLVMELVTGDPLSLVIARRGRMPARTAVRLMAQAAEALHAAHRVGVIHRDVKPGNLILRTDGTLKITDFGIARAVNSVPMTDAGQIIGTARYMSPEQASGDPATPASDIYSLGVVGYELLAGHPPFTADNPAALALAHVHHPPDPLPADVPASVQDAIARALAKDPASRPGDAGAFARELRRLSTSGSSALPAETERGTAPATVIDDRSGSPASTTLAARPSPTAVMPARPVLTRTVRRARRGRRTLPAIAISALAGVVALIVTLPAHDGQGAGGTTTSAPPPTTAAPVTVDPNALIGRSAEEASRVLSAAGLTVKLRMVPAPGTAPGVVTGVEPTGTLPPGATVVLDVSSDAPDTTTPATTADAGHGRDNGRAKGKHKD